MGLPPLPEVPQLQGPGSCSSPTSPEALLQQAVLPVLPRDSYAVSQHCPCKPCQPEKSVRMLQNKPVLCKKKALYAEGIDKPPACPLAPTHPSLEIPVLKDVVFRLPQKRSQVQPSVLVYCCSAFYLAQHIRIWSGLYMYVTFPVNACPLNVLQPTVLHMETKE